MTLSVIILAAGSSSRMGTPKQLLKWKGDTLLSHSVKTAMGLKAGPIYVVLGSNEEEHRKAIKDLPVTIVSNPAWANGMGSSLKAGLNVVREKSEAVLVMTCDMPFVTADHLKTLVKTDSDVVASKYGNSAGVPAKFSKKIYSDLLLISDTEGAKKIIEKHSPVLIHLDSPTDLDTPDDYQKALSTN